MSIHGATILPSAVRAATTTSQRQTNPGALGVTLFLNVTANPGGAETLQVSIQMVDVLSGAKRILATFPVTTAAANATYVYILCPGASEAIATANVEVQPLPLPEQFEVVVTHSASGNWTYSLTASYTPGD